MNVRAAKTLTKVQTSGLAGAIVAVLVWLAKQYGRIELPAEVVVALTTILMVVVAYITPLLPGEVELIETVKDATETHTHPDPTQHPSRPVAGASGGAMPASPDQRATSPAPDTLRRSETEIAREIRATEAHMNRLRRELNGEKI